MSNTEISIPGAVAVIDTCSLIRANSIPREIFPSFWDDFIGYLSRGEVVIIQPIFDEFKPKDSSSAQFLEEQGIQLLVPSPAVMVMAGEIMDQFPDWVSTETTKNGADPVLVAQALESGVLVITEESQDLNRRKIPQICHQKGVEYSSLWQFFTQNGKKY